VTQYELEEMMQTHDWYYMMSDDYVVFKVGDRNLNKIVVNLKNTSPHRALALWEKYSQGQDINVHKTIKNMLLERC